MLYTVVDLLGAAALMQIAESGQSATTRLFQSSRKELRWSSIGIAAGYALALPRDSKPATNTIKLPLQSLYCRDMHRQIDVRLDQSLRSRGHSKGVTGRQYHIRICPLGRLIPIDAPYPSVPAIATPML